ncbi:molecular chaperone TorD family protein [uncultured Thiodictyon sp.]|jgi:TorA maturation chaperone TorD|uniref:molecular chaperone TorD family protein n=1 Tax=uncultured Thiodictyon sp. TaxID=1846217 RepID=UPI0025CCC3B1|nr:molecular chaperone TorD family protein [uncultured Thiodictyon sp.]
MAPNDCVLAKAELYLCLARAFAVPNGPGTRQSLAEALPADLDDLAPATGYPIARAATELREAMARVPDDERLLVMYSRLFLVPGEAHPSLNAGVYLDGALGGGTVAALEECLRRCALETDAALHDLPDHLSVQLELLAWLLAAQAQDAPPSAQPPQFTAQALLERFVGRWVGPFRQELEAFSLRFGLPDNPYLILARVLETAVLHEVRLAPPVPPVQTLDPEIARLRSQLAGQALTEDDMAIIRQRLAADGLPHGHVAIPVYERDRTMGLSTMTPPTAPSHRRSAVSGA